MNNQLPLRNLLHNEFLQKRKKNPAFSIRAFARQAGISPGSLSEFLRGKRNISYKLAQKVVDKLTIPPDEAKSALTESFQKKESIKINYTELEMDQYYIIADWFHFAILSLVETKYFKNDINWIANRLNIHKRDAKEALNRLIRLNLIKELNGKLKLTRERFITSDGVPNVSLKKSHHQNLELAQVSLDRDDVSTRDFSSVTMAIDPKKLPEAVKKIRNFYNELTQTLERGEKTEVYRFCGQLFPLTLGENNEN